MLHLSSPSFAEHEEILCLGKTLAKIFRGQARMGLASTGVLELRLTTLRLGPQ